MASLRIRFAPDPAALPGVVVRLAPLSDYEALLGCEIAPDSAPHQKLSISIILFEETGIRSGHFSRET
jgi:hypothetical protein